MATIAGLPYYELTYDATGTLTDDGGLAAALAAGGITDVFVFSHGWNDSVQSARSLYQGMFTMIAGMIGPVLKTSAAVGVLWPSLLFPDDEPGAPATPSTGAQLAAALTPAFPGQQENLATMGSLLDQQPQDATQLVQFHQLACGLVTTPPLAPEDEGPQAIITGDPSAVFGHAAAMAATETAAAEAAGSGPGPGAASGPGASGGDNAEGLPNPFTALWSGAREVLRTLSYYEMKNRAGVVGRTGLGPFIGGFENVRFHLAGHSFGARLVSFALTGLPEAAVSPVKSLTLVQGAFSHFSFADPTPCSAVPSGTLACVLNRIDGPALATFTAADRCLGWWYPAASMLAHQNAESLIDLTYEWGGMGHDGFQQSPAGTTVVMLAQGEPYDFSGGGVYLLDANKVICADLSAFSGAHSDIQHPEVAWAIVSAAAL
jgi:hypothetical protein